MAGTAQAGLLRQAVGLIGAFLAGPAAAQAVSECGEPPPVTALVEPWEETSVSLGEGAIRLALLHRELEEGVSLLVLTLPPVGEDAAEATAAAAPPPLALRCRIVTEGGIGFAVLDVGGVEVTEDPEAATLTARLPALRFVPESTELEELVLAITFGVADDPLSATIETP